MNRRSIKHLHGKQVAVTLSGYPGLLHGRLLSAGPLTAWLDTADGESIFVPYTRILSVQDVTP